MEVWKPVVGWEGLYEVSNFGRIRSMPRTVIRSNGRRLTIAKKIISAPPNSRGYPSCSLWRNNKATPVAVHVVVARAFHGECPPGKEVRHLDGKKTNCRQSNLRYGTHSENNQDKIAHGTMARGEGNGKAKLTEALVIELRQRHAVGDISYQKLGEEYGIPARTVAGAVGGDTWRWLHG